jgi:hypothetical protein
MRGCAAGGAADRPGTGDWLAAGAGGRAALTGLWLCGSTARYTAAEVAATTADAVPQAAGWARSTLAALRSQPMPGASSSTADGAGSNVLQPARREARSAARTAARWRSGSSVSDT